MADRQDIDALLVGALYGELSSADHQRLEAHLASHPQDRAALDAMTHTRGRLREGLAAVPDAEPPPGVSALLLQEAARRAPSRTSAGAGLWAWLENAMRSMAAHPGLAAAAAVVLMAGVAGSYVLSGGRSPMHEASAPSTVAMAPEPAPQAQQPAAAAPVDLAAETYEAHLAEPRPGDVPAAAVVPDNRTAAAVRDGAPKAKNAPPEPEVDDGVAAYAFSKKPGADDKKQLEAVLRDLDAESAGAKGAKPEKVARAERRYVPVTTPEPSLKEEEQEGAARGRADSLARQETTESVAAPTAAAPPSAPSPVVVTGGVRAGAAPYDPAREQERDEWARAMHQKVLSAVKRRDCTTAATFAAEISVRASDYYVKRVSGDRAVLPCKPAIDRARKKEADRRSRAPTKDSATDEAAPTTSH